MDWWPANNSYSDGVEARKSYFDRNWGNSVIRSLSRWKLDLTNTDLTVRSVRLETEVGKLVKQWTEDMQNVYIHIGITVSLYSNIIWQQNYISK